MHIEQRDEEIFITNSAPEDVCHIGWKSKRLGCTAFDVHGNKVVGLVPVFALIEEVDEAGIFDDFEDQALSANVHAKARRTTDEVLAAAMK